MSSNFLGNVILKGKIECLSGLHIGGEDYNIGVADKPVLKDPKGIPYIPGSLIKGKLRSLLEWSLPDTLRNDGEVHVCQNDKCPICRIFGTIPVRTFTSGKTYERKIGPTRLIVRDSYPDEIEKIKKNGLILETKIENRLNRITTASETRLIERVPQGTKFNMELIYSIYNIDKDNGKLDLEYLSYLFLGLRLLENSAIGGGISRGSGHIAITLSEEPIVKSIKVYEEGKPLLPKESKFLSITEIKVDQFIAKIRENLVG